MEQSAKEHIKELELILLKPEVRKSKERMNEEAIKKYPKFKKFRVFKSMHRLF